MSSSVGTAGATAAAEAGTREPDTSANRFRLSIVDVTFILFCLIPPLVFGPQLLNSDGDAARHIRMGELMLERGLYTTDPFSWTEPGNPIMLTEWGSRIVYALAHAAAGLAGVALLAGLLIGVSCALVVLLLLRRGVDPLLAYGSGILVAVVGQVHWLARPHLFTLVALALLLFLLEPGEKRRLWWFAPLFVVWTNLHGGFVLGLMLLATAAGGAVAEAYLSPDRRAHWLGLARWYGAGLAIAMVAACANPRGPVVMFHVFDLLGSEAARITHEFQPPDFREFYGKLFILLLGLVMAVLTLVTRRLTMPRLALLLLMLAGGLVARRNIPLFGLIVVPLIALHANAAWRGIAWQRLAHVRSVFEEGERIARPGLWSPLALAAVVALGFTRGSLAGAPLVPDRFDPEVFPVEAVEWARANDVSGRIFHAYTWGGYMVYAWPEQPIFIDGMSDYFSEELLRDFATINRLEPGWAERMDERRIDLALLPPESSLASELERETGWTRLYSDSTAVLLRRDEPTDH